MTQLWLYGTGYHASGTREHMLALLRLYVRAGQVPYLVEEEA